MKHFLINIIKNETLLDLPSGVGGKKIVLIFYLVMKCNVMKDFLVLILKNVEVSR
jgi:hypothetical protein